MARPMVCLVVCTSGFSPAATRVPALNRSATRTQWAIGRAAAARAAGSKLFNRADALFRRADFGAAEKGGMFIDHKAGRFNVALQRASGLKLAPLGRENISFHIAADMDRLRSDFSFDPRVFSDGEETARLDLSLHFAVD